MNRTRTLMGTIAVAGVMSAGTGAAVALAHEPAGLAGATTVGLHSSSLGRILVDGRGHTLYAFTRDRSNHDTCASIRGCSGDWPLLSTAGRAVAGRGVKGSLLGRIRVGRAYQVTYAGRPLYRHMGDSGTAATGYVGVRQYGGRWYAISAAGHTVSGY